MIQKIFFYIIKINNFRGERTDISALKEALVRICLVQYCQDLDPITRSAPITARSKKKNVRDSFSLISHIPLLVILLLLMLQSSHPNKYLFLLENNLQDSTLPKTCQLSLKTSSPCPNATFTTGTALPAVVWVHHW